ncbi:MAG TPA: MFS transporter [Candidatus Corynebacterium avicola]|uniref:MFS transporter n=1 Tax=Candidatus Corynebacterium avicola TaxID=2838527 RepID=A0A9D1RLA3_9CORY|nr:MFS transporter [Candidatus Corynebacterium avicola]
MPTTKTSTTETPTSGTADANKNDHHPPGSTVGLVLCTALIALAMAGSTAPSPFYPSWQSDLDVGTSFMSVVFGIYPIVLLVALLTVGSLSDHLGRRPVAVAAFILLALSFVLMGFGVSPVTLILARCLQGVGVALAMSTLGAYAAELQPPRLAGVGALLNSAGPTAGLALGALVGGFGLEFLAAEADVRLSAQVVFGILAVLSLLGVVLVWNHPETSPRKPGVARSLRPSVRVHRGARSAFLHSAPVIAAVWATGGLFISLGANIISEGFGSSDHLVQVLPVVLLTGVGATSVLVARRVPVRSSSIAGCGALIIGTALGAFGVGAHVLPLYIAALVITGVGWGVAYAAALRVLLPLAPASERAALFSAVYVVAYLSFGIPAIIAGVISTRVGLIPTVIGYGVVVILAAAASLVLSLRHGKDGAMGSQPA